MQTLVERGCGLAVHKGYRGGLFVDCFAEWASSEADSSIESIQKYRSIEYFQGRAILTQSAV